MVNMRAAVIKDAEGFTWCSVKEAARALRCSRMSLWRWAKAGYLETSVTQTGRRLYRKDSVQHLRNPGVPYWRDIRDEMEPAPADQPKPGPRAPVMRPWRDMAAALRRRLPGRAAPPADARGVPRGGRHRRRGHPRQQ